MAAAAVYPMLEDKLTNEIFSILENKFLFGGAGKVRILTIDGGGDAVLAATSLVRLQCILRAKSGNPSAHIADFFDVVAGSGTGGVLAALLFTKKGKDGAPIMSADEALKFLIDNRRKSSAGVLGRFRRKKSYLRKVFGELTLKETVKGVLIPCYDLRSGAPLVFSRADAFQMDGCDFAMAAVCEATLAEERAVQVKSVDGMRKIVAVGGKVGMSNPSAAAITHVLNNKKEFPLCNSLQDLLLLSLANSNSIIPSDIAADGAADMVDQAVSMAFGEARTSNYVRIQGNGGGSRGGKKSSSLRRAEEILGQKNVESVLFRGKKVVGLTNMEKMEIFGGEMLKEEERRRNNNALLPTVLLKTSNTTNSPRSSSATTLSSN